MPRPLTLKERKQLRKAILIMRLKKEQKMRQNFMKKFPGKKIVKGTFLFFLIKGLLWCVVFVAAYIGFK